MERVIENRIFIACAPTQVYDYVTQPWRWHEWHPSSQSAVADARVMAKGACFDEVIRLQPLSPLPLTIRRQTRYQVVQAERGVCWEVRGETAGGDLSIRYELREDGDGTQFFRRLRYQVTGAMRVVEPLLYPRMQTLSRVALNNLCQRLQNGTT